MLVDDPEAIIPASVIQMGLSPFVRHKILVYVGILVGLLAFGSPYGGLIDIPVSFFQQAKIRGIRRCRVPPGGFIAALLVFCVRIHP